MERTIYISEFDLKRLESLIEENLRNGKNKNQMLDLRRELNRAKVVVPEKIPPDVITMNSVVRLQDFHHGARRDRTYRL